MDSKAEVQGYIDDWRRDHPDKAARLDHLDRSTLMARIDAQASRIAALGAAVAAAQAVAMEAVEPEPPHNGAMRVMVRVPALTWQRFRDALFALADER